MKFDIEHFSALAAEIEEKLKEMDKKRDEIIDITNKIIKYAGRCIENFHRNDVEQSQNEINIVEAQIKELNSILRREPYFYSMGSVNVAFQEYVEAKLLLSITQQRVLPTPKDLQVPGFTYILGIADLIGELRRYTLEKLVNGELSEAKNVYELMKLFYNVFLNIEYGKNLAGDFRRKKDTARILLERTLSDLFVATQGKLLSEKINKMSSK